MNITVAHLTKGGSGKTTLATNIYVELQRRKYICALLDFDEDQQASKNFRDKRIHHTKVTNFLLNPHDEKIAELFKNEDTIICDTGGYDNLTSQALIASSDIVLIPMAMNDIEVNSFVKFSEKIDIIRKVTKTNTHFVIVPSRINAGEDLLSINAYFEPLSKLGYSITYPMKHRVVYPRAYNAGKGVIEMSDKKAQNEIYSIVNDILKLGV